MENKQHLFLVEDDLSFGAVLKSYLELNDYEEIGRVGSALQYLRDRTGAIYLAVKEKVGLLINCFKG